MNNDSAHSIAYVTEKTEDKSHEGGGGRETNSAERATPAQQPPTRQPKMEQDPRTETDETREERGEGRLRKNNFAAD